MTVQGTIIAIVVAPVMTVRGIGRAVITVTTIMTVISIVTIITVITTATSYDSL